MYIGGVKVIDNYLEVDTQNVDTFQNNGTYNSGKYMYTCIICGQTTCIDGSMSYRGHRLMCENHVKQIFDTYDKAFL